MYTQSSDKHSLKKDRYGKNKAMLNYDP